MKVSSGLLGVAAGAGLGVVAALFYLGQPRPAGAASNDRYGDYVMCTGAVSINPKVQTDGVWLLDYRCGKLLGTVIDRNAGKIVGWAEVDLTTEFAIAPRQDVHFMMTSGYVTQGQSALYVAETTTGKFGVYTMGPGQNGGTVVIRRHDQTTFRQAAPPAGPAAGAPPGPGSGTVPVGATVPPPEPKSPAAEPKLMPEPKPLPDPKPAMSALPPLPAVTVPVPLPPAPIPLPTTPISP